jgi:hypothetical protein
MNKEGFSKLNCEVGALIEMLIGAYTGYFQWHPMMFSEALVQKINEEKRVAGFMHFRDLAYRMLILDLVNLCADDDKNRRTPSIKVIWEKISEPSARAYLRQRHTNFGSRPLATGEAKSPRRIVHLRKYFAKKSFDDAFAETEGMVRLLIQSPTLKGYRMVRDKLLAHRELKLDGERYSKLDIGTLGLRYGQEHDVLDQAREIADRLNFMVRNASFGWDTVEKNEKRSAMRFWQLD